MMVETRDFQEAARNNPQKDLAFYIEKGERKGCWTQC